MKKLNPKTEIKIFASLEAAIIGIAIILTVWLLLLGPTPEILLKHGYQNSEALYRHILFFTLLYGPILIGVIGVLKFKQWGRKLLIIMNCILIGNYMYRLYINHFELKITALISYGWAFWLIYYFSKPKVVQEFKK